MCVCVFVCVSSSTCWGLRFLRRGCKFWDVLYGCEWSSAGIVWDWEREGERERVTVHGWSIWRSVSSCCVYCSWYMHLCVAAKTEFTEDVMIGMWMNLPHSWSVSTSPLFLPDDVCTSGLEHLMAGHDYFLFVFNPACYGRSTGSNCNLSAQLLEWLAWNLAGSIPIAHSKRDLLLAVGETVLTKVTSFSCLPDGFYLLYLVQLDSLLKKEVAVDWVLCCRLCLVCG